MRIYIDDRVNENPIRDHSFPYVTDERIADTLQKDYDFVVSSSFGEPVLIITGDKTRKENKEVK